MFHDLIASFMILGKKTDPTPVSLNSKILRYLNDHAIPDQPMFLAAIVAALKLDNMRHLHSHWTSLVTNCLPFLDHSLTSTVIEVTSQLAQNLEKLAPFYADEQVNLNTTLSLKLRMKSLIYGPG